MDLGTPTSEGYGRSPVRVRGLVSLFMINQSKGSSFTLGFYKQKFLVGRADVLTAVLNSGVDLLFS